MAMRHVVEVGQFDRPWLEALFAEADRMRDLPADRAAARRPHPGDALLRAVDPDPAQLRVGDAPPRRQRHLHRERPRVLLGDQGRDGRGHGPDRRRLRRRHRHPPPRAGRGAHAPPPSRRCRSSTAATAPASTRPRRCSTSTRIRHELGRMDGLRIALVGDLRFGRTARSLALLFCLTDDTELVFVSPPAVPMGATSATRSIAHGVRYRDETDLAARAARRRRRLPDPHPARAFRHARTSTRPPAASTSSTERIARPACDPHAVVLHPLPARRRDRPRGRRRSPRRLLPPGPQRRLRPDGAARPAADRLGVTWIDLGVRSSRRRSVSGP